MSFFQDLRTGTWAFLEAYGWLTVFIVILAYMIYKKYIYDLVRARAEARQLIEQKKFDRQVHDNEKEKIRLARERQQEDHNEKERMEIIMREEKEREEREKTRKELDEQEKTCQVLGHYSSTASASFHPAAKEDPQQQAIDILNNLTGSAAIVIFGNSDCPDFRKVCQLVSTYRFDTSKFQVFEFDKQSEWPVEEVLEEIEARFDTRKSPFVFICGKFIGGLEETRNYDRKHGLNTAQLMPFE